MKLSHKIRNQLTKRKKFIITSLLLSFGFVGIQLMDDQYRYLSITILGLATLILFAWSLWEGLGKNMTLATLILPVLFTLGVGLFWFLLPSNIFARIPVVIIYGFGIYALCLTANIYTVAAIRTIALLRAARGVGFVLTLFTSFLIFDTILSLRTPLFITSLFSFFISLPIFLQGLWVIRLEPKPDRGFLLSTLIYSLVIGEISLSLHFWPVTVVVGSLFLTVSIYVLLGLGQMYEEGRLFSQTVREYLLVGLVVFIGMFFATRWGA